MESRTTKHVRSIDRKEGLLQSPMLPSVVKYGDEYKSQYSPPIFRYSWMHEYSFFYAGTEDWGYRELKRTQRPERVVTVGSLPAESVVLLVLYRAFYNLE